jgi:hypothetical protein
VVAAFGLTKSDAAKDIPSAPFQSPRTTIVVPGRIANGPVRAPRIRADVAVAVVPVAKRKRDVAVPGFSIHAAKSWPPLRSSTTGSPSAASGRSVSARDALHSPCWNVL